LQRDKPKKHFEEWKRKKILNFKHLKRSMQQKEKISQEQLYDMLLSKELSWQEIIYDLIQSEQLDPWDINIALLASKYLDKIRRLEEANFFISSKVLFAASILLRIKSELLLSRYIRSLDEILFGKKEEARRYERIVLDEEIPELLPKTPLPRLKKVTLQELMQSLERAIATEQRRIKKDIALRYAGKNITFVLPRAKVNIRERIVNLYNRIMEFFRQKPNEKLTYTMLTGSEKEEKIASFLPLLHLDSQGKVFLEQEKHFDEIYILLQQQLKQKQGFVNIGWLANP
jgi:segregation and condensation protein A